MKTWAKINDDNLVVDLIKVDDTKENVKEWLISRLGGTWEQTFSKADVENGQDEQRNGKPAIIGGSFDSNRKVFIDPQPYPSWILSDTDDWIAPVPIPDDGREYAWNESISDWELVEYKEK